MRIAKFGVFGLLGMSDTETYSNDDWSLWSNSLAFSYNPDITFTKSLYKFQFTISTVLQRFTEKANTYSSFDLKYLR